MFGASPVVIAGLIFLFLSLTFQRGRVWKYPHVAGAADPKFHAVVDEHRKNGSFAGLDEDTPGPSLPCLS